ncbi:MAG: hypothetical protein M3R59_10515 [Verrucomicrobiota bacterium]|nr:hypothetical protein [Verrucomicrobiota bacterium]
MKRNFLSALFIIALFISTVFGQTKQPQVPPTFPHPTTHTIPTKLLLAVVAVAIFIAIGALMVALRAARRANFFDRVYRFTGGEKIPLRLGGDRCGGFVVSMRFEPRR